MAPKLDLASIIVYDPASNGITASVMEAIRAINPNAALILHMALSERVLESRLPGDRTLNSALYGRNGVLKTGEVHYVIFSGGRLHSRYSIEAAPKAASLDDIQKATGLPAFGYWAPTD